ncbi:hypothetical protein MNBD_GAMMA11-2219 [hydrothermal vent metagenome]|uniref:DUF3187 family protein n=1 Tax=hydrothermal vent metagenome TaxID=652676 RepID=A0A3B0XAU4_9ZZZZ
MYESLGGSLNNIRYAYFIKLISIKYVIFVLLLILSARIQADNYAPEPYWQGTLGPLNIRSMSPGQALRLAPLPRSPYGLPEGKTELQFNMAAASVFLQSPGIYLVDFNFIDTRIAVNHGFKGGWSTELSFSDRRIQNLYLDEFVEAFHDVFGIDQNGRDINQNETRIIIPGYSANFSNDLDGVFSQTIGLSVQKVLIDKSVEWPALAVILNTSIETLSDGMIEKGAFDYSLQLSLAEKKLSGYYFANVSYTRFGSDKTLGVIPLSEKQFSGMLGYEFSVTENEAFIVQYLFSEGVLQNLGALGRVSHEIHLGYKWRTDKNTYEAGLVENIVNFDNGPDVAFAFGVTHRL